MTTVYPNLLYQTEHPTTLLVSLWLTNVDDMHNYHQVSFGRVPDLVVNDAVIPVCADTATALYLQDKPVKYICEPYLYDTETRLRITKLEVGTPLATSPDAVTIPLAEFIEKFETHHKK